MHYGTPDRHSRGVVLVPAIAASVAAIVWAAMTWMGFAEDNPWIWLASIVLPVVVAYPASLIIARTRLAHDKAERRGRRGARHVVAGTMGTVMMQPGTHAGVAPARRLQQQCRKGLFFLPMPLKLHGDAGISVSGRMNGYVAM